MIYTLDRFEGEYAILLLRPDEVEQVDVLIKNLPSSVKEGDILEIKFTENGDLEAVRILEEETAQSKEKVESLIQKLIDKNKK